MENRVITPKIRLGKSVSISVKSSVGYSISVWGSVYDSVGDSLRSSIDSSMWTPIRNLTTWEIKL